MSSTTSSSLPFTIMSNRNALDAVIYSLMEYCALTVPVLLYVALEAFHDRGSAFLLTSPEWGIATVFLAIHGPGVFEDEVERGGRTLSVLRMRFFRGSALVLAGAALINSLMSFDGETPAQIALRITMFAAASIVFVAVVGAARHIALRGPSRLSP